MLSVLRVYGIVRQENGRVIYLVLSEGKVSSNYKVIQVDGKEKDRKFLFTLGCYEGQDITLISMLAGNYVINIKDSRYAIDQSLARLITVEEV